MQRNDDSTAPLSRRDRAGLEFATRARWSIRSKGYRVARLELSNGTEQSTRGAPPAGSPDGSISQRLREIREILSFAGLAHHDGDPLMAVLPEERQQYFVPEEKHVRSAGLVEGPPSLLVHRPDPPGGCENSDGRTREHADRARRNPQPHAPSSSSASATTRIVAPGAPSR